MCSSDLTVTPQGVFVLANQAASGAPSAPVGIDVPGSLRWSFPGGTQITELAAVGDHGSVAWLGRSGNSSRFTLAATTATSPPSAVREFANPTASGVIRMEAADQAEYAVTVYATSAGSTIQFLDTHSTVPIWTKNVSYDAAVDISADGRFEIGRAHV